MLIFFCVGIHVFFFLFLFSQADDGAFVAVCNVNITIRDVNNHAPKFVRDNYMATIAENTAIGKCAMRLFAVSANVFSFRIFAPILFVYL